MKKKNGFNLRTVCGEKIIVAEGKENIDFSNIIVLNESAAYLWEKVSDNEFTAEEMAKWLTEEYDIDEETAKRDANTLAKQWMEAGIINAKRDKEYHSITNHIPTTLPHQRTFNTATQKRLHIYLFGNKKITNFAFANTYTQH